MRWERKIESTGDENRKKSEFNESERELNVKVEWGWEEETFSLSLSLSLSLMNEYVTRETRVKLVREEKKTLLSLLFGMFVCESSGTVADAILLAKGRKKRKRERRKLMQAGTKSRPLFRPPVYSEQEK